MFKIHLFILSVLLFIPGLGYSNYKSLDELLGKLNQAGFNQVMEISTKNINALTIHLDSDYEISLNSYVATYGAKRVPSMDIAGNSLVSTNYSAYIVANSFLCYDYNNISRSIFKGPNFQYCLIIPVPIDQVIDALEDKRLKNEVIEEKSIN